MTSSLSTFTLRHHLSAHFLRLDPHLRGLTLTPGVRSQPPKDFTPTLGGGGGGEGGEGSFNSGRSVKVMVNPGRVPPKSKGPLSCINLCIPKLYITKSPPLHFLGLLCCQYFRFIASNKSISLLSSLVPKQSSLL